jgi:hypothetical protein
MLIVRHRPAGAPAGLGLVASALIGRSPGALTNDLSATQTQILTAAAGQPDGRAMPPAGLPATARNAVLRSLLKAGLLEVEEGAWAALRITQAGCRRLAASLQASRGIRAAATRGLAGTQGWSRTSTGARPRLCQMCLRRGWSGYHPRKSTEQVGGKGQAWLRLGPLFLGAEWRLAPQRCFSNGCQTSSREAGEALARCANGRSPSFGSAVVPRPKTTKAPLPRGLV